MEEDILTLLGTLLGYCIIAVGIYLIIMGIAALIGMILGSDGIIGDIANIILWLLRNWWKILIGGLIVIVVFCNVILPILVDWFSPSVVADWLSPLFKGIE